MKFGIEDGYDLALNQGKNDHYNNTFYISDKIRSGNMNDLAVGAVVASHEGGHLGYDPITESDGLDKLYDIDVNVWNGLQKAFKGKLQNRELEGLAGIKAIANKSKNNSLFSNYVNNNYNVKDKTAREFITLKEMKAATSRGQRGILVGGGMACFAGYMFQKLLLQRRLKIASIALLQKMIKHVDSVQDDIYNMTYNSLHVYAPQLIKDLGSKGKAMVMMGKALVQA